jgi:predicted phosphate transport protein (TIGR00153 family)
MFRLLPREEKYFDMFNNMASHMTEGALLLQKLFNDFERHGEYADKIKGIEHTCDEITHDIVRRLNQTFITPIDREDIHALASQLDDVVDYIEYVSRRSVLFRIESTSPYAQRMSDVIVRMVSTLEQAVIALGRHGDTVLQKCLELHALENEGDMIHHEAVEHLFQNERDPIRLLKWKDLYEALEEAIDKCEDVSNTLEGIVLKNA